MYNTIRKIKKDYYDIIKKVKKCRGENDHETIENLLRDFAHYDIEIKGEPLVHDDNHHIHTINILRDDCCIENIKFDNWDLGNHKLNISFDIFTELYTVYGENAIFNVTIKKLEDAFYELIGNCNANFVVTKVKDNNCCKIEIANDLLSAQKIMIDFFVKDLLEIKKYINPFSGADITQLFNNRKKRIFQISKDRIYYNDPFYGKFEYKISLPENEF